MKKKPNFKKLALMGLASGTIFAGQASAEMVDQNSQGHEMAFAGCGGNHGCSGQSAGSWNRGNVSNNVPRANSTYPTDAQGQPAMPDGMQQPRTMNPPQGSYYYNDPNAPQPSQSQVQKTPGYASGCASPRAPQYSASGCASPRAPQYTAAGCASPRAPQYSSAGCGSQAAPQMQAWNQRNVRTSNANINPNLDPSMQDPTMPGRPGEPGRSGSPTSSANKGWNTYTADNMDMNKPSMNEAQMLSKMSEQEKATYQSMDINQKALVRKAAGMNPSMNGQR